MNVLLMLLVLIDPSYLCANSTRYYDGVAIGPNKVLTGLAATPKRQRGDVQTVFTDGLGYGAAGPREATLGVFTTKWKGIGLIETHDPVDEWTNVDYRAPVMGERFTVVSKKQNFVVTCKMVGFKRDSNKFYVDFAYGNTGCGVYDSDGDVIGIWHGYETYNGRMTGRGIVLAFGTFR